MNTNFTQADHPLQARCIGCESLRPATPLAGSHLITCLQTGRSAYVCPACSERAADSDVFRRQIEACTSAGVSLAKVRAVFARVGVDVPTTLPSFIAGVLRAVAP